MFFFPRSRRLKSVPCIILYREYFYMRSNYFLEFFLHVFFQAQKCKKISSLKVIESCVWTVVKLLSRSISWMGSSAVRRDIIVLHDILYIKPLHLLTYIHISRLIFEESVSRIDEQTNQLLHPFFHLPLSSTPPFIPRLYPFLFFFVKIESRYFQEILSEIRGLFPR